MPFRVMHSAVAPFLEPGTLLFVGAEHAHGSAKSLHWMETIEAQKTRAKTVLRVAQKLKAILVVARILAVDHAVVLVAVPIAPSAFSRLATSFPLPYCYC